jgi:NhaA family Na+:H+ antiporter
MATDTAIAIGTLAALGSRVPKSVTAFLVGLAIIDDIGAILVIALVYTEQLALPALAAAVLLLAMLMVFNRAGLRHPLGYIVGGIALWVAIVQSGVHASIAGVVVAATVPARPRLRPRAMRRWIFDEAAKVPPEAEPRDVLGEADTHRQINRVERIAQAATTPLRRWEDGMELPVALAVLPLFAFLNAGIPVTTAALVDSVTQPVALGILFGLVLGKPAGILAGVWLSERLGLAVRPTELSYRRLLGIGLLAGVGFTMSTFIANLALGAAGEALATAKLAIVMASVLAATAGYFSLRSAAKPA